ncbi:phosphate-starvation-inducible PsiE family protein [Natranaeroarchaeum aerophilus]|uniref:Phosphate-starvation-inducible PsiE family protein n=1 Tax=Natranaeroarchaeum aerophilus TaxID=2917711 RepID=A0AAE3FQ63_9EURY|nr:phosphate-starvation-inducible PsiE family protein [Natranaeroarchaeum aerophilus]MCL9812838.1 phosphate-starvation-inducible PsiE family protein [Natranaeroarchaeum aerophilus]
MDSRVSQFAVPSQTAMDWLVLATAYVLLVLFLIGVFDVLIGLYGLFVTGQFTEPVALVRLLDTVLLLLIIVEVHRTLLAYVRDEPVIRIVIGAAIIAVAREIISFRLDDFATTDDALTAASAFSLLLIVLVVAYYVVYARIE